jgi:hypothetical protein
MPQDHDTKTWSYLGKILCSTNRVRSRSGWSKTSNALWSRCMTPTILSTKLGISQWKNLDYPSGFVIMTHTHDDFKCPSPRNYAETKSWLAYEQNPYSTHWVRSIFCHRETSLGYDILHVITRLYANMNISYDWYANLTSSLDGNTSMLWARGLCNFTTCSTTLSCCTMWSYLTILVVCSVFGWTITRYHHLQATVQKEEDLMKIAYAKIWSSTSVVCLRFEDSHFEDFKLWTPKLIP